MIQSKENLDAKVIEDVEKKINKLDVAAENRNKILQEKMENLQKHVSLKIIPNTLKSRETENVFFINCR